MFRKFIFTVSFVLLVTALFSVTVPTTPEPIYGGRIEHIRTIATSSTETRVFISTNSANSMFYADMTNVTTTPIYGNYQVVPDLDYLADYGWLRNFAADEGSQFVFAITNGFGLVACDISSGSLYTVDSSIAEAVETYDSHLYYLTYSGGDIYLNYALIYNTSFGPSCGQVYNTGSVLVASTTFGSEYSPVIMINPDNRKLYIFEYGTPPTFYKSSDDYDAINTFTTFSNITVSDLATVGKIFIAAGIAPDGRIIVGGYTGNSSSFDAYVAYSDADGDPWNYTSIASLDAGRGEIQITRRDTASYNVAFSRVVSMDNGISWDMHGGADGSIYFDPNNDDLLYVRTDWAMGACELGPPHSVTETPEEILAVQVNDLAMNYNLPIPKDIAWVATKSGIWYVHDYSTAAPVWTTTPLWPTSDSTPYVSVETSVTADSVYAGNTSGRAFKYESAYGALSNGNFQEIFDAQSLDPTWTYGTEVASIALDTFDLSTERLFLGTYDAEDWDETTDSQGGIFVGEYSGSWNWTQLSGSPIPTNGVDINDVEMMEEGGVSVAYAGAEYHYDAACGTGFGVYRIEDDGAGGWNVTQDLFDSTGTVIAVTIFDLCIDRLKNIYASGIDASWTTVVAYYKEYGTSYWQVLPVSGLPTSLEGKSITVDYSTGDVYMAIENDVYYLAAGATSWSVVLSYPEGTDIEFIYYDDLLIGTTIGLYSMDTTSIPPSPPANVSIWLDGTNVNLEWDAVAGATSYTIYSDSDPYGSFSTVEDAGITSTTWYEPIPGGDTMKFYRVTAEK